ncbi:hypothetical protein bcCo53_001210 (plasmid) [Borrelia coriaceae]|nr:hypothetical protein [Borrelia coriaceae]UPA17041.1 hypothetical protein bcCo53_001210 [Borrelia coriaceae]
MNVKSFSVFILFLSTFTLSCKFYDTANASDLQADGDKFSQGFSSFNDILPFSDLKINKDVSTGSLKAQGTSSIKGDEKKGKGTSKDPIKDQEASGLKGVGVAGAGAKSFGDDGKKEEVVSKDSLKNEGTSGTAEVLKVSKEVEVAGVDTAKPAGGNGEEVASISENYLQNQETLVAQGAGVGSVGDAIGDRSLFFKNTDSNNAEQVVATEDLLVGASEGVNTSDLGLKVAIPTDHVRGDVVATETQNAEKKGDKTQNTELASLDIKDNITVNVVDGTKININKNSSNTNESINVTKDGVNTVIKGVETSIKTADGKVVVKKRTLKKGLKKKNSKKQASKSKTPEAAVVGNKKNVDTNMSSVIGLDSEALGKDKNIDLDSKSDETYVIERVEKLAKYLQSAIKINGKKVEEQDKLEAGRQKFFEWLSKNDTDLLKRKALVQDLQKIYDLMKDKIADSTELQDWFQIVSDDIGDEETNIIDVESYYELSSDTEIDFLLERTLEDENYSGFSISLFMQALADTLYDIQNDSHKSGEEILQELKRVFDDTFYKIRGFEEFKSQIAAED